MLIYENIYKKFRKIPIEQRNGIYEVGNFATFYYVNGKEHREDGPAQEYINGDKFWLINGEFHRLDGPSIECIDGRKYYYVEGVEYSTKEEFDKVVYLYKNGLQDYL